MSENDNVINPTDEYSDEATDDRTAVVIKSFTVSKPGIQEATAMELTSEDTTVSTSGITGDVATVIGPAFARNETATISYQTLPLNTATLTDNPGIYAWGLFLILVAIVVIITAFILSLKQIKKERQYQEELEANAEERCKEPVEINQV